MTRAEDGSALMLVPAAVLVLLVLAAIAVDTAVVLLAQRDLVNRTAAAANDVAALAADDGAFYERGQVTIDEDVADAYVGRAFGAATPSQYRSWGADAHTAGGDTVVVEAWADVRPVFAGFWRDATRVEARSTATAAEH